MMRIAIVYLLFVIVLSNAQSTPHFPEVFLGKCYERNPTNVDCNALLANFSNGATTDNAIVNDTYYDGFFAMANFSTTVNTSLFWSGSYAFAGAMSTADTRFYAMEETSAGYILNGLSWCGTPNHTYDYVNPCLFPSNETYYGTQGVWNRASAKFAQGAEGDTYVLLGLTAPQYLAFRNNSVFSETELPNMNPEKVTSVTVLVLRNLTQAPDERCGSGSLVTLSHRVYEKFNFTPNCIDDPETLYNLLCPSGAQLSAQCQAASLVYRYDLKTNTIDHETWAIAATVAGGVCFLLVLILALRLNSIRKRDYETVRTR